MTATEAIASAFGILGTLLLALNGPRAGWGFVAFLASNAGWILFALHHQHWGLLAQQLVFTVTSCIGTYVWIVRPLMRGIQEVHLAPAGPDEIYDHDSPRRHPVGFTTPGGQP